VRTTVRIDDALYRQVKSEAARTGRTVGELIEDAIRMKLVREQQVPEAALPELPRFEGQPGLMPGVDLSDNAALRDLLDDGEPLDALR
jgi:hypothetical protein